MLKANQLNCIFCNGSGFINYLLLQCQPDENINFFTRIKKIFTDNNQICRNCKGNGFVRFELSKHKLPRMLINSVSVPNIVIMKPSKKKKIKKIKKRKKIKEIKKLKKIYNNRIHTKNIIHTSNSENNLRFY
jgi:hypothetical protein